MLFDEKDAAPISSMEDLLAPFYGACKAKDRWRIGTEAEKFGVFEDGTPLPFEGERSVSAILNHLGKSFGWHAESEFEGGPIIALTRGRESITLEPGGQLELSGAPLESIHETCTEFNTHMRELAGVSEAMGVTWLGLGFHPIAHESELPWVPKLRYGIMKSYLPTRGTRSHDMMQRTATVQANFDYASEKDAIRKLRTSLALSPIVQAMFANSPFAECQATGERSHRAWVWLDVDNDRSGLLPFAWKEDSSFESYIEWALDVPMFMVKRGPKILKNTGQTFRNFMLNGFEGAVATDVDWETHINTMFPEVRLKRTLEVRSADGQQTPLLCALPALWTGLLYDDIAFEKAEALASGIHFEEMQNLRGQIAHKGLRAELGGRELAAWSSDLFTIAWDGLVRRNIKSAAGLDETCHLSKLKALVDKGISPADALLAELDISKDFVQQMLRIAKL